MIDFLYLIIILGSLQGLIIGTLFLSSRRSAYPERLLAFIIWATALPGFHLYLHYRHFFVLEGTSAVIHAVIPWILVTAIGPLILFYTRAVTNPDFRIGRKEAAWFLPVLIDLFPKIVELLQLSGIPGMTGTEVANFADLYNKYADIPRWIVMALCILIADRELRRFRTMNAASAEQQPHSLRWLSQFIGAFRYFLLLWLVFLIPYVLPVSDRLLDAVGWFPVYIPMSVLIYWLGIRGYLAARHSEAAQVPQFKRKTAIEENEMIRIIQQLTRLMNEKKLYLDPELDLAAVSTLSQIPSRSISWSLNQHLGKTFNQYLNEFRVEEFKQRASSLQDLSIAGLASVCGFPSLATFQRVFKQVTGQTPTGYLRETGAARLFKS